MKIVDNKNPNVSFWEKINKKYLIIGLSCLLVVVAIALFVGLTNGGIGAMFAGGPDGANQSQSGEQPGMVKDVNQQDEGNELEQIPVEGSTPENDPVQEVVSYTTIKTDEKSLIELVKNTVKYAKQELDKGLNREHSGEQLKEVLEALEHADKNAVDIKSVFLGPDGKTSPLDQYDEATKQVKATELKFDDVAGSIGTDLFYQNELVGVYRSGDLLLQRFVAYGLYSADVNQLSGWSIDAGNNREFAANKDLKIEVNFVVKFTLNNLKYEALIGNINNEYRVLDIVRPQEVPPVVKETPTPTQPPANTTPSKPAPVQPAKPEYKPSDKDTVEKGPEGDKPGYIYVPGYGYVKDEGGGVDIGDNPNDASDPGKPIGNMN
jgi:hypothetical protein